MLTSLGRRARLGLLGVAIALPAPMLAQVNFDALPQGNYQLVPLGYGGYNWYRGDGAFGGGTQLEYSTLSSLCRSTSNCAYNAFGNIEIRIESATATPADLFTFKGYFSGAGYPGFGTGAPQMLAQGFVGSSSTAAFSTLFAIPADGSYTLVDLTATGVNKLLFSPLDATGQPSGFLQGYLLVDDVTFAAAPITTATPEPATLALLGTGLVVVGVVRRRRARSA